MAELRRTVALLGGLAVVLAACGPAATATPAPREAPPTAPRVVATPTAISTPSARLAATATPKPSPTTAPSGPKVGGVIRHPQREDPSTWDPSKTHIDSMSSTKYLVFTGLFTMWSDPPKHCKKDVYPQAVKSWRWVDDTTAEFTLKQGIKYQNKPPVNGREMVAADVPPSFLRYQKGMSFMAGKSAQVESVTAKDKYTFQMKLKTPWGGFLEELMAHQYAPWVEPPEAGGPDGKLWEFPEKSWVGSGPFQFDKWTPGVKWRVVRNADYWQQGKPYLDAVEYAVIPEASTQLAALRSGQLNFIREFSEPLITEVANKLPGIQIIRCPSGSLSGPGSLWMNNSGPPFDDVRVRRAASMAIDQQAIISLYDKRASPSMVLPPGIPGALLLEDFPPEVRQFLEYHPDRSKQLLAQAGYPNGFDTVVNFTARYAAPSAMVAEAATSMLQAVGVRARLNLMEYGRFLETVVQAKYPVGQMAISAVSVNSLEDAHALFSFWSEAGAVNRSIVRDPEYDDLFKRFMTTVDQAKRRALARELQIMAAQKSYRVLLPMPDSTMTALPGIHFTWMGSTRDYSMMLETAWIE